MNESLIITYILLFTTKLNYPFKQNASDHFVGRGQKKKPQKVNNLKYFYTCNILNFTKNKPKAELFKKLVLPTSHTFLSYMQMRLSTEVLHLLRE